MAYAGKLRSVRLGRSYRIPAAEVHRIPVTQFHQLIRNVTR